MAEKEATETKAAEPEAVEEPKEASAEAAEEAAPKEDVKMEDAKEEAKKEGDEEAKEEVKEEDEMEEVKEEEAEPEVRELEEDAAADTRAKVAAGAVTWSASDSTMNVMPVAGGSLLMSVVSGGCQYLLAGVRATAGVKAGRYMFEVKIVESLNLHEPHGSQGRTPAPRNLVRIGLSLQGSSLYLAGTADSVCFDSEGYFFNGKKRSKAGEKFWKDHTVSLVVNLDEKSPNANTVSLFRDGERASPPQKLPEHFAGKVLYPTLTYKNVSVHVNMGPQPLAPLPFSCRMLQDAAKADVEVAPAAASGPSEVIFPVGLPDQGVFDYVDSFLEQHPQHIELSDRATLDWASKSGIWRPKRDNSRNMANDKPDMNFGIPMLDDGSVGEICGAIAPALKRNYVLMELRGNLLADERKKAVAKFSGPGFKKKAVVLVGEPSAEYKKKVQELLLAEKASKAEADRRKKAAEDERQRLLDEKKKKAEESRKAREAKKSNGNEEEEKKEEENVEAEEKVETKMDEEPPAAIELTEEEKQLWYRKTANPDIAKDVLAKSYAHFTLPSQDEGFDEIIYAWQPKAKADTHMREWLLEQKRTQKAEDLEPSQWFKDEFDSWRKALQEWKKAQNDWKDPVRRKYVQKKREEEAEKKKAEEKKEGDAAGEEEKEESKPEPMDIKAEDIEDVDSVENVDDIGTGEPLYSNFVYEDWTLLALRFELHLLINAFRKDLNDEDRPSFTEEHLEYYYGKYFKKTFSLKNYGVEKMVDFLEMIEDTISLEENGMFKSLLPEETLPTKFVKLAEEHRRDRARRVDAGDETAQLKFKKPAPPPPRQPDGRDRYSRDDKGKGRDRRDNDKGKGGKSRDSDKGKGSSDRDRRGYDQGKSSSRPTHSGHYSNSQPPSRYSDSSNSGGYHSYGHSGGGSSSYGSQKRSYGSSSYPPSKQQRGSYR